VKSPTRAIESHVDHQSAKTA